MRNENPNWPASTYNGFAGATPPPAAEPPSRRLSRPLLFGGIAAAVAAGVALGFVAQPKPVSAAKAEAAVTPMAVELAEPAPPAVQPAAGKLDVRPTDVAAAAQTPRTLELPPAPQAASAPAPAPPRMQERLQGPPVIREAPPPEVEIDRSTYEDAPAFDDEPEGPSPF